MMPRTTSSVKPEMMLALIVRYYILYFNKSKRIRAANYLSGFHIPSRVVGTVNLAVILRWDASVLPLMS